VTPSFFATVKGRLVRGRDFNDNDTLARPWVVMMNESMARRFWPGEDPIGKRITLDAVPEEQSREVIAIVPDIPVRRAEAASDPFLHASYLRQPSRYRGPPNGRGKITSLRRSPSPASSVIPAVRSAVAEIDPDHAVANVSSMANYLGGRMLERRDYALVLGIF